MPTGEQLDEIERSLVGVVRAEDLRLCRPRLRDSYVAVVAKVEKLPWQEDPMAAIDPAVEILKEEIDPAADDGDVPWTLALHKLGENPKAGSLVARKWFATLVRARLEDRPVSSTVEAVASYAVAAFETVLGREHEVFIWAQTAATMTDYEGRPGLSLVVIVRAAKLLAAILPRTREP